MSVNPTSTQSSVTPPAQSGGQGSLKVQETHVTETTSLLGGVLTKTEETTEKSVGKRTSQRETVQIGADPAGKTSSSSPVTVTRDKKTFTGVQTAEKTTKVAGVTTGYRAGGFAGSKASANLGGHISCPCVIA